MPWRKVSGKPGRGPSQYGRAMPIASVEIRRPQDHDSEYLVLAVAVGGLAESVVCGASVMLQSRLGGRGPGLTYHNLRLDGGSM